MRIWIFDLKDDFRHLAVQYGFRVLHPNLALNLLQPLPFLSWPEQVAIFITVFCKAFYAAEHAKQILAETLRTVPPPSSLAELCRVITALFGKGDTYQRRDAGMGVLARLQRLADRYPGLFAIT